MKRFYFLIALPGLLLMSSCNSMGNHDTDKQKSDSAAAAAHLDSLMKASNSQQRQDSMNQRGHDSVGIDHSQPK